jgi:hypothetical protein
MALVVAPPGAHEYDEAPFPVSVVLLPKHTTAVEGLIPTTGFGETLISIGPAVTVVEEAVQVTRARYNKLDVMPGTAYVVLLVPTFVQVAPSGDDCHCIVVPVVVCPDNVNVGDALPQNDVPEPEVIVPEAIVLLTVT